MEITGRTKVCFMLADPIDHVRAPEVFNPLYRERHGIDVVMVPMHVTPAGLAAFFDSLRVMENVLGLVVSVPHKAAIVELADDVGKAARQMNAANAVRREAGGRIACDNFDGAGFMAGLYKQGFEVSGKDVLLVGAGGAGSALALSLAGAGATKLAIYDIVPERHERLAGQVAKHYPDCRVAPGSPSPSAYHMVINATPCGMHDGDPLPIETAGLRPDTEVVEIIMKPETTPLLAAAIEKGCRVQHGRHMLDEQLRLLAQFMGACQPGV